MNKRNGTIDFLKFLFSMIIVFYHFGSYNEKSIFNGGAYCVEFFFIISGCMMVQSFERIGVGELGSDTLKFMKHKVASIVPNVWVAWSIAFLFKHIIDKSFSVQLIKDLEGSVWDLLFISESGINIYCANESTWYISAMLLAMLVIYPLMHRYRSTFFYIIAPIICVFGLGNIYQNFGTLIGGNNWNGLIYGYVIRAYIGICAGCISYKIASKLGGGGGKALPVRIAFTILEGGIYLVIIAVMYKHGSAEAGFLIFLLIIIAVIITVSGVSFSNIFFSREVYYWMGRYSFSLYLGHYYWATWIKTIFPDNWKYNTCLATFLLLSFCVGLFIMYMSIGLRTIGGLIYLRLKERLIADTM